MDLDWRALADRDATLAIYMGREAAGEISRSLIDAGLPATTPVLIACDVSLPGEKLFYTRLDLLPIATAAIAEGLPTLIIVGDAVAERASGNALSDAMKTHGSNYADGQV